MTIFTSILVPISGMGQTLTIASDGKNTLNGNISAINLYDGSHVNPGSNTISVYNDIANKSNGWNLNSGDVRYNALWVGDVGQASVTIDILNGFFSLASSLCVASQERYSYNSFRYGSGSGSMLLCKLGTSDTAGYNSTLVITNSNNNNQGAVSFWLPTIIAPGGSLVLNKGVSFSTDIQTKYVINKGGTINDPAPIPSIRLDGTASYRAALVIGGLATSESPPGPVVAPNGIGSSGYGEIAFNHTAPANNAYNFTPNINGQIIVNLYNGATILSGNNDYARETVINPNNTASIVSLIIANSRAISPNSGFIIFGLLDLSNVYDAATISTIDGGGAKGIIKMGTGAINMTAAASWGGTITGPINGAINLSKSNFATSFQAINSSAGSVITLSNSGATFTDSTIQGRLAQGQTITFVGQNTLGSNQGNAYTQNFVNSGALIFKGAADINGSISGSGSITVDSGAGNKVNFSGNNSYYGFTVIKTGIMAYKNATNNSISPNTAYVNIYPSASIDSSSSTTPAIIKNLQNPSGIDTSGNLIIGVGGLQSKCSIRDGCIFSGNISGSGGVILAGSYVLGGNNSYTGPTQIGDTSTDVFHSVTLTSELAIPVDSVTTVSANSILYSGSLSISIDTLTNQGTINVGAGGLIVNTLTNDNFIAINTGELAVATLTNSGSITIFAGGLKANSTTNTGTIAIGTGGLSVKSIISDSGKIIGNGNLEITGQGSSDIGISENKGTVTIGNNNQDAAIVNLTDANSFAYAESIYVYAGATLNGLSSPNTDTRQLKSIVNNGIVNFSNALIDKLENSATINVSDTLQVKSLQNNDLSAISGNGGLTILGQAVLGGNNSYAGPTKILGQAILQSDTALPKNADLTIDGTLHMNGQMISLSSLSGSGTIDFSNGNILLNNGDSLATKSGGTLDIVGGGIFSGTLKGVSGIVNIDIEGQRFVLSGDSQSFMGSFNLNTGVTIFNGIQLNQAEINVNSGAMLYMSENPTSNTITNVKDIKFATDSVYIVIINDQGIANMISAENSAVFAPGAKLAVTLKEGTKIPSDLKAFKPIPLLKAKTLTYTAINTALTFDSAYTPFLTVIDDTIDGTKFLVLNLRNSNQPTSSGSIDLSTDQDSLSINERELLNVISEANNQNNLQNEEGELFGGILRSLSPQEAIELLDKIVPVQLNQAQEFAVDESKDLGEVNIASTAHLVAASEGITRAAGKVGYAPSSIDNKKQRSTSFKETNIWMRGVSIWGRVWENIIGNDGKLKTGAGSKKEMLGIFMGADTIVADNLLFGFMAGYGKGNVTEVKKLSDAKSIAELNGLSQKKRGYIDSYHIGLYSGFNSGALSLRITANGAFHNIRTFNPISGIPAALSTNTDSNADPNGLYSAVYTSFSAITIAELAYAYNIDSNRFEFFVQGFGTYMHTDNFKEDGPSVLFVTKVKDTEDAEFLSTIGARGEFGLPSSANNLKIRGEIGWQHNFDHGPILPIEMEEGRISFEMIGEDVENALITAIGLVAPLTSSTVLELGYRGRYSDINRDHVATVDLKARL